jgi:hypothetical protein
VAAVFVAVVLIGYRAVRSEHEADEHDAALVAPSRVEQGADGSIVVKLDAAAQQKAALVVEPAKAATRVREEKAYGRVLDPTPLIAASAEEATARATLDAAEKELRRVRTLAAGQNASARTVEAADTAVTQARIALDAAHAKLLVGWGDGVANRTDVSDLIHALAVGEAALARVDLEPGRTFVPAAVRVVTLDGKTSADAQVLGSAANVDPQTQGPGFFAVVRPNTAHLLAGQAIVAYVAADAAARTGVIVAANAAVRNDGKAWIYVRVAPDTFARREVALDEPIDGGWFVTSGVSAGEAVVVTGAQTLLSEELKSALPAED